MLIQQLVEADWQRMRALRLAALQDAPDAFGATYDDAAQRTESDWRAQISSLPTFVVTLDGIDIGMVRGGTDEDDPTVAWLLSMWVAPGQRNRSIGRTLVNTVVEWSRGQGFARLLLDVADDNHGAIALYASVGFKPTGITGNLPPPREHIQEHQQALDLYPASSGE